MMIMMKMIVMVIMVILMIMYNEDDSNRNADKIAVNNVDQDFMTECFGFYKAWKDHSGYFYRQDTSPFVVLSSFTSRILRTDLPKRYEPKLLRSCPLRTAPALRHLISTEATLYNSSNR